MFKKFWNKINGFKTITGVLVTAAGVGMFHVPFLQPAAGYVLGTGLGMLGIGGVHKITKKVNQNKEK